MFKRFRSLFITFAILGSLVILTGSRYGTPPSTTPSIVDDGSTISFSSDLVPSSANARSLGSNTLYLNGIFTRGNIQRGNDANTFIDFSQSDTIEITTNNLSGILISLGEFDPAGIVINQDGHGTGTFRIETDTITDAFEVNLATEIALFNVPQGHGNTAVALGAAAVTFSAATNFVTVTGDGGTNTIATITSGTTGETLTLLFTDALVTVTDNDTHSADSVDLNAAFTGADDTTLVLLYDGTSWYELSRSVN